MKFFSTLVASSAVLLSLVAHVSAHAAPTPLLGIQGAPKRDQVQRPSDSKPCGNTNIAKSIDSSASVPVSSDGTTVFVNVTNFNGGQDGSRKMTALVDPTGTGKSFVKANVTVNGDPKPKTNAAELLTIELPEGTKCTGGTAGNLCLLSLKSDAGFGGCTLAAQTLAASSASGSSSGTKVPCKKTGKAKRNSRAVGTRAARFARAEGIHVNPVF